MKNLCEIIGCRNKGYYIGNLGFITTPDMCKKHKLEFIKKMSEILKLEYKKMVKEY